MQVKPFIVIKLPNLTGVLIKKLIQFPKIVRCRYFKKSNHYLHYRQRRHHPPKSIPVFSCKMVRHSDLIKQEFDFPIPVLKNDKD